METSNLTGKGAIQKGKFDGTVALLAAGSIYLLLGLALNAIIQVYYIAIPAAIASLLGLYAAYVLSGGKANKAAFAAALSSIIIGLAVTFVVFLLGVIPVGDGSTLLGSTGAAWIIYALAAFWLWRNSRQ